jgi:hypothetical protein
MIASHTQRGVLDNARCEDQLAYLRGNRSFCLTGFHSQTASFQSNPATILLVQWLILLKKLMKSIVSGSPPPQSGLSKTIWGSSR